MGMAVGMPEVKEPPAAVDFVKNPLADTHEFRQACSICFVNYGKGPFDISSFVLCVFSLDLLVCFFSLYFLFAQVQAS